MINFFASVVRMLLAGVLMVIVGSAAAQQAYPSKPIRLISPYAPGGTNDTVARLISQKLGQRLGQVVIVDNRPGAGTIIGTEAVARSTPDGYTILLASSSLVLVPQLVATRYDAIKDFAPVATIDKWEFMLVLNPSVPVNDLKEFIAYAKARPGEMNYASPGTGGVQHLAGELLGLMARIKMQHIAYKGAGPAMIDVMGGQVQAYFASPIVAIPYIRSGKLKAIAIGAEARAPALPQVPTFSEAGLPDYIMRSWQGIVAPAGTPKVIIERLSIEIAKMLAMPDVKEELLRQGMDPFVSTPDQMAALMVAEVTKYARIIRDANIKLEN